MLEQELLYHALFIGSLMSSDWTNKILMYLSENHKFIGRREKINWLNKNKIPSLSLQTINSLIKDDDLDKTYFLKIFNDKLSWNDDFEDDLIIEVSKNGWKIYDSKKIIEAIIFDQDKLRLSGKKLRNLYNMILPLI
mgnify:FL=1